MKKSILYLIFSICCINANAQKLSWVNNVGSTSTAGGSIFAIDMVVDYFGNTINVGTCYDSYDFDPGPAVFTPTFYPSSPMVYLQKLNTIGGLVWAKTIGGPFQNITVSNIVTEQNGNIIISGTYEGTIDFDPGIGVQNQTSVTRDLYVLKLDAFGNFIWVKSIGGSNWTFAGSLAISDGYLVGGSYSGIVDFDPSSGVFNDTALNSDGYVLKLNPNGNFAWVKTFRTIGNCQVFAINEDDASNIIIGGNFGGDTDFDPGPGVFNIATLNPSPPFYPVDCFVCKMTSTGNLIWAKSFGGNNEEYVRGLILTSDNDIIINGTFNTTTDFDPSTAIFNLTAVLTDAYFLKLDSAGNFVWAKSLEGSNFTEVSNVVIDTKDQLYCTGAFQGTVDFDLDTSTNFITAVNSDIFVLVLDKDGNTIDADVLDGADYESGIALTVDRNSNIYSTGYFVSTMDFDPQLSVANLTPQNLYKWAYTFKWSPCPNSTSSTIFATGCTYTYNGLTYTGNGTYVQLIPNSIGCDSIITIELTESSTNTYIDTLACTGSYTLNGQTYTTSGLYVQPNLNIAGCDSNFYLNLAIGNYSFDSISVTSCDFYVSNQAFYGTSGVYTEIYTNSTGCDSTVTLNLTINPSSNSNLVFVNCDSLVYNGNVYTSSGLYSIFYSGVNGCDSVISIDLTIPIIDTAVVQIGQQLIATQGATSYQWVTCPGYIPIPVQTLSSYYVTTSGSYAVIIEQNGCFDTSNCITVSVSGIDDNFFENDFRISPNPAFDQINIETTNLIGDLRVNITSITGQILLTRYATNIDKINLDLSSLSKGIYFLNISNEKNSIVRKISKL